MLVSYSLTGSQTLADMLGVPYELALTSFVFLLFMIIFVCRRHITAVISYLIILKEPDIYTQLKQNRNSDYHCLRSNV